MAVKIDLGSMMGALRDGNASLKQCQAAHVMLTLMHAGLSWDAAEDLYCHLVVGLIVESTD